MIVELIPELYEILRTMFSIDTVQQGRSKTTHRKTALVVEAIEPKHMFRSIEKKGVIFGQLLAVK